jgi:hypothetical protein
MSTLPFAIFEDDVGTYGRRLLEHSDFPFILGLARIGIRELAHKHFRTCRDVLAVRTFRRGGHITEADGVATRDERDSVLRFQ